MKHAHSDGIAGEQSLLAKADLTRHQISGSLDQTHRSKLGQFMTPSPVASFMASMFGKVPATVNLLDAGAGFGALTAAFVHEMCARRSKPNAINVTAFELEPALADALEDTLKACVEECNRTDIKFKWRVIRDDFIHAAASPMFSEGIGFDLYDCAILNPPYAKIQSTSKARKALRIIGIETSNLYTAFVAIAVKQLKPQGQLVAITPRSFCNGPYFQPFRELLLKQTALQRIHVYESRKKAFSDDAVLQENIVFRVTKTCVKPKSVVISLNHGPSDPTVSKRQIPYGEVVLPNDPNLFIRIATSQDDSALAVQVRRLPCALADLGIEVSTGRVVEFRATKYLIRGEAGRDTAPLIYPTHFENGFVRWPKLKSKKPNAIVDCDETKGLLVPKGMYVLTKRFSSKEERRRLVAAIYDPNRMSVKRVGFENHLNYFHCNGHGLPEILAKGLAVFLNSGAVDLYFRQFSGHTQVNATDLRNLHYPSVDKLHELGSCVVQRMPPQEAIDDLVNALLQDRR